MILRRKKKKTKKKKSKRRFLSKSNLNKINPLTSMKKYVAFGSFVVGLILFLEYLAPEFFDISFIDYFVRVNSLSIANISLTAGSIILSFFIAILADRKMQIGRGIALVIWFATMFLLISSITSLLVGIGLDHGIAIMTVVNIILALLLIIIIIGSWSLKRGYYEERNLGNSGNAHSDSRNSRGRVASSSR